MAKQQVKLTFPEELIREPVIGKMTKQYQVMPNIRRAKVTETLGELVMELQGPEDELERALAYLRQQGVRVEPLVGDIVE